MVLASEYLDKNYPKEKRSEITELTITGKNLSGTLDLSDFTNLEELRCRKNQLTQLILPPNNKLRIIDCDNNQLTSFNYTKLNPETCTELYLWNNNFAPTDISLFSHLINLTFLVIGNEGEWIQKDNQGNQFFGSLKSLQNCTKLNHLDIRNTNINQGLEYLPQSLETFYCYHLAVSNFKVQELVAEIKKWGGNWKEYQKKLFEVWKKQGFSVQELQEWKNAGLTLNDYLLAYYLKKDGYQPQQITNDNLPELRKKYSWQDLHADFDNACQTRAKWEAKNLTHSEVKEWLKLGLQPKDYDNSWLNLGIEEAKEWFVLGFNRQDYNLAQQWKSRVFNHQEVKKWLEIGFKLQDYQEAKGWKEIGSKETQEWLSIGFSKGDFSLVEEWKSKNFDSQQIQEWINQGWKTNESKLAKKWLDHGFTPQKSQSLISVGFGKNLSDNDYQIIEKWRTNNFEIQEIKEWIEKGLTKNEHNFANYLKSERNLTPQSITRDQLIKLRNEYVWWQEGFDHEQRKELIEISFQSEDYELAKQWKEKGFVFKQIKKWVVAGVNPNDYDFATWLKNVKQETSEWIINYQADYQILNERFKKYSLCSECQQPNTGEKWCKDCNAQRLQKDFNQWDSGNQKINDFIQKCQVEAIEANKILEWIPYEQFTNIEFLAKGGFGKVYKAQWPAGNINHWDQKNKKWIRNKDHYYYEKDKVEWDFKKNNEKYKRYKNYQTIVFKSLTNSVDNIDFLQETEKFKIIDDWFNNIVPCYGLSQDPEGNYLMVMKYMPDRDLRVYLRKNNRNLKLFDKFNQLINIARGLKDIHQKNLVHRDFHSGNILKGIEQTSCLITDLGLCKPADQISQEEKIFGVLPYVAPEVLQSQPYTQASDIYSFGIISYELLSGLPPYYDRDHDVKLGVAICQGLRPQFQIKIPQLLEDLINRCWDNDPSKRPTAIVLEKELQKQYEFRTQIQDSDWQNKMLPDSVKFPKYQIHQGAVYHSKLLPTQEITKILQTSSLSTCSTLVGESSSTMILPTKQIVQLAQDLDNQQQSLILEIKKMEKEIGKAFSEEQKELLKKFIQVQKKLIENKKDKEAKKSIKEIEKQLEEEKFADEEIEKIIGYCKRFVKSEQELESEKLEANVELLTIKEI